MNDLLSILTLLSFCIFAIFRRMKDPAANDIPSGFVELWQDAIKTNSKAGSLYIYYIYVCTTYIHFAVWNVFLLQMPYMFCNVLSLPFRLQKVHCLKNGYTLGKIGVCPLNYDMICVRP